MAKRQVDKGFQDAQGIHYPMRRLLTLEEAAIYLGRKVSSLRELVYAREIPVVQLGDRSKIWIDIQRLDEWIDSHEKYL